LWLVGFTERGETLARSDQLVRPYSKDEAGQISLLHRNVRRRTSKYSMNFL